MLVFDMDGDAFGASGALVRMPGFEPGGNAGLHSLSLSRETLSVSMPQRSNALAHPARIAWKFHGSSRELTASIGFPPA